MIYYLLNLPTTTHDRSVKKKRIHSIMIYYLLNLPTTTHFSGTIPIFFAANRNKSGAGLPLATFFRLFST